MRQVFAILALACLTACGATHTKPEQAAVRLNDDLRGQQVALDVIVIARGMEQAARERQEALAARSRMVRSRSYLGH